MIVTEEEAKIKWCPEARVGGPMGSEAEGTTANRWPGEAPNTNGNYCCIGSACMAWMWVDKEHTNVARSGPPKWEINPERRGCCGKVRHWEAQP